MLHLRHAILLSAFADPAFGQTCVLNDPHETDPTNPLIYPITSGRYAVQYQNGQRRLDR